MSDSVSCIIPVYNEAPRVLSVLKTLLESTRIQQILLVNDGSTDSLLEVITPFLSEKVTLISHPHNLGKAAAMYTGVQNARFSTLIFIDADLKNLSIKELEQIIVPVQQNRFDMVVGNREPEYYKWSKGFFAGERCFRRTEEITNLFKSAQNTRYSIELILNRYFLDNKKRIATVRWNSVRQTFKGGKRGLVTGLIQEIRMLNGMRKNFGLIALVRYMYKFIKNAHIISQ